MSDTAGSAAPSAAIAALDTPLRVVIAGEVNSGKSALINAIARENIMPSFFGHDWRPAMIATYSPEAYIELRYQDGSAKRVSKPEDIESPDGIVMCHIGCAQPHLRQLMLIEIPFYHDGEVQDGALALMASADVTIWTTIASQAWRLSEKSILDALESHDRNRAILAVSRADKLRSQNDWERVRGRMHDETGDYFSAVTYLAAGARAVEQAGQSDEAWADTGGQRIFDLLSEHAVEIAKERSSHDASAEVTPINPQPEEPAKPVTRAPLPELIAPTPRHQELSALVETMNGVLSAGILDAQQRVAPIYGDQEAVQRTGQAVLIAAKSDIERMGFAGDDPSELETQIVTKRHLIQYHRLGGRDEILFMMCLATKMNPAIARTAFSRLAQAAH